MHADGNWEGNTGGSFFCRQWATEAVEYGRPAAKAMSHEEEKDLRPRRNRVTNATRQGAARAGYVPGPARPPEKEIVEASAVRKDMPPPIESTPPSNLLNITPENLRPQSGVPQQASSTNAAQSPRVEKAEPNNPVSKWEPLLAIVRRIVLCIGLLITTLIIIYPNGTSTVTTTSRRRASSIDSPSYSTRNTYTTHGREFIGTYNFNVHKGRTIAEALISLSFTLGIVWALRPPRSKKEK